MSRGVKIHKLCAWRTRNGFTMDEAAGMVVVDGDPCTKSTWHGWEHGKVPKPPFMVAVCTLTGLEPNDFYPALAASSGNNPGSDDGRTGGASAPRAKGGNGEPPQMVFAL